MYSDGSLFDQRAKMRTSRKMRVKLAKHRRSARKGPSTEAAREEPEPEPTELSTAATSAASHRPLCTHRYLICLLLPMAVGPKIICRQFVHLPISEPTPGPSGTQRQTTPGTSQTACATETFLGSRHSRLPVTLFL